MKLFTKTILILLTISALFFSCDKDTNPEPQKSREIKYEIIGTATGTFDVSYTPATGGIITEEITSLPWVKRITIQQQIPSVGLIATTKSAISGQTISVKIYAGNEIVSEGLFRLFRAMV